MKQTVLTAAIALLAGFAGAAAWSLTGLADDRTRSYLLANPQLLPQMADAYETQQQEQRLAAVSQEVMKPFPGAVLGNPEGSKVLVEFTDYNCPYCRMSKEEVAKLVESDPDVKVVIREWPIFQGSDIASRMALAAARQGKYRQFHEAMFRNAPVTPQSVRISAEEAGLDLEQAQRDGMSQAVETELQRNLSLATRLGFTGTPSWVTEERAFEGLVEADTLREALVPADS